VDYVTATAEALAHFDHELALSMLERAAPAIAGRISANFPEAYEYLQDTFRYPLGFVEKIFDPPPPTSRQRAVARTILQGVEVGQIVHSIARSPRRALSNMGRFLITIHRAAPSVVRDVVEHLDLAELDRTTAGLWASPPHELAEFVSAIARFDNNWEPARTWITRHGTEMRTVPARFAIFAPEAVLAALRAGGRVDLGLSDVLRWKLPLFVLATIAERDEVAARAVAIDHVSDLAKGFQVLQTNQCEDLDRFVELLQGVAPEALAMAFGRVDPEQARGHWAARLRGKAVERRAAGALVIAAASTSGPCQAIGKELLRRFPSVTRRASRAGAAVHSGESQHDE
jgi:hypothetical protein